MSPYLTDTMQSVTTHHSPPLTTHHSPLLSHYLHTQGIMAHEGNKNHFLLVTYPAQGHINPALQFAKCVIRTGARVTFVTSVYAHRRMLNNSSLHIHGLTLSPFSDGYDDGFKSNDDNDADHYISEMRRRGSDHLSDLIESFAKEGSHVTCVICTLLLAWAVEVARKFQLSSALLWIQPATVFDVYYYYFSGYKELMGDKLEDPSYCVELQGLPPLKAQDLPSFILPSNTYAAGLKLFQEQFETLSQEAKSFRILVNTFDELEAEALEAVDKFNLIGIGPLIPSAFLDGTDPSDKSFGGDLFNGSKEYTEWLDSMDNLSVVYVSFGTLAVLSEKQMEELARGLVDSGRPFLWIIRSGENGIKQVDGKDEDEKYMEILGEEHKGVIVSWCSQLEVLNHPSIGCFITHCGWNSTLEALAMGVPVVAFPQWTDQGTNAKLIEDVWKIGVRVRPAEEDKIVKSKEIIRCLNQVMGGEKGEGMRRNAMKWKVLAREAVKEGGSSARNLQAFMEEVRQVPV